MQATSGTYTVTYGITFVPMVSVVQWVALLIAISTQEGGRGAGQEHVPHFATDTLILDVIVFFCLTSTIDLIS